MVEDERADFYHLHDSPKASEAVSPNREPETIAPIPRPNKQCQRAQHEARPIGKSELGSFHQFFTTNSPIRHPSLNSAE